MALEQYKLGGTYYGYDADTGQGFAASNNDPGSLFHTTFNGQFDPNAKDLPVDPTPFNSTPNQVLYHPQVLAKKAGEAGLSVTDYQKLQGSSNLTPEQKTKIYSDLGIPDV